MRRGVAYDMTRGRGVELIRQRNDYDCGVCCLAMALGAPYEEIIDILPRDITKPLPGVPDDGRIGLMSNEAQRILWERGVPSFIDRPPECYRNDAEHRWRFQHAASIYVLSIDQISEALARGQRAMLGITSLNVPDGYHWIYASGGYLFDPSPNRTVQDLGECQVAEAILIGQPTLAADR